MPGAPRLNQFSECYSFEPEWFAFVPEFLFIFKDNELGDEFASILFDYWNVLNGNLKSLGLKGSETGLDCF
jgi:hypothetical protein